MIRVYIASKLSEAERFRRMREDWKKHNIDLHARWFDQASLEDSSSSEDFSIFWLVDEEDVKASHALILYAPPDQHLRGALVEAGIAIASGILVIIIDNEHPDYGTWKYHPMVIRAGSFEHAKTMLLRRFR